jgi:hypothetical protein
MASVIVCVIWAFVMGGDVDLLRRFKDSRIQNSKIEVKK